MGAGAERIEGIKDDTVRFQIVLNYTTTKRNPFVGKVEITGPVPLKGLCYMILDIAKDIVKEFDPTKQAGPGIIVPDFVAPGNIGNG